MKIWSRRLLVAAAALAVVLVIAFTSPRAAAQSGQSTPAPKFKTAGEVFKNVTTASLKGISVDDFMGSMGVMAAALGFDCSDCHTGAGTDKVDWVYDTPRKKTARKMVDMVAAINKNNFGGAQMVTCWTCHHGREFPSTTIALDHLYGPPNDEHNDIVMADSNEPSADKILDKYIQAEGGAAKLATLKSYIATGTSLGYGGLGGGGEFTIYAQYPDKRTTSIFFKDHPDRGDSVRSFNGTTGWIQTPRALLKNYELDGSELEGAKLDAQLSFPGQIKQALTNWRVGVPDSINDKEVKVVQGRGPRGVLGTFYFDKDTGLLTRLVRYDTSPIGRVPIQIDYSDYRAVDGIMFPFQYTFSWLDGRDSFKIDNVKINVPIDESKFGQPK